MTEPDKKPQDQEPSQATDRDGNPPPVVEVVRTEVHVKVNPDAKTGKKP